MLPRDQAVALWIVAGCTFALAALEFQNPTHPPFTGRWAWLHRWAYATFGDLGVAILLVSAAGFLVLLGAAAWLKAQKARNGSTR